MSEESRCKDDYPVDVRALNERMGNIEREMTETHKCRNHHISQMDKILDSMQDEQRKSKYRIEIMEKVLQKVTQLLEGYSGDDGLVKRISNQEQRIMQLEMKVYVAVGALAVIQIVFGLGLIPPIN